MSLSDPLSRFHPLLEMPIDAGQLATAESTATTAISDAEMSAAADRIRAHDSTMRAGAVAYLHMGVEFSRVHQATQHGQWLLWCKQFEAIGLGLRTIERMIQAADKAGDKIDTLSNLKIPKTTVYALTKKTTPEPIWRDFLAKIEAGSDEHAIRAAVIEANEAVRAVEAERQKEARRAKMTPEAKAQAEKREAAAQKRYEREVAQREAQKSAREAAMIDAMALLVSRLGDDAEQFAVLAESTDNYGLETLARKLRETVKPAPAEASWDEDTPTSAGAKPDSLDDLLDAFEALDAKPIVTADVRAAVLAKFAKARAIRDGTDNAGTRDAAAGRMQVLASKIGMTVEQAVAALDAPKLVTPQAPNLSDLFRDLMNTPEHRAWANEQAQKRDARRAAALAEYGSEDAVWEPCERERALEDSCRPYIVRKPVMNGDIDTLQGWDGGGWDRLAPDAQKAVANAYVMPETMRATWDEFMYWEKRIDDQCAFEPDVSHPLCVQARVAFLEDRLDTLAARSVADLKARVAWLQFEVERGFVGQQETERLRLATLRDDVVRMGDRLRGQADRIRELESELAAREPGPAGEFPENPF